MNCPSGTISAEMTDFDATKTGQTEEGIDVWTATAKGTVINRTSRPVRDIDVEATLQTDNADSDSDGSVISGWVGTGSQASWTAEFRRYESNEKPSKNDVSVAVTGWSWGDGYEQCPKQGSSS